MSFEASLTSGRQIWHFGADQLQPLHASIKYTGDPSRLPRTVELSLCDQLASAGGYFISPADPNIQPDSVLRHRFESEGEILQFQVRAQAGSFLKQGFVAGQIYIRDNERDNELAPLDVQVEIKTIQQAELDYSPLVLDFGGSNTVFAARDDYGNTDCLDGFPIRSRVALAHTGSELVIASPLAPTRQPRFFIDNIKARLASGDISQKVEADITAQQVVEAHLHHAIQRALRARRRRPPELIVTVPAGWATNQISNMTLMLNNVLERLQIADTPFRFVDEASAGGVGILRQDVAKGDAAAALRLVDRPGEPTTFCSIDVGSISTDLNVGTLDIQRSEPASDENFPRFQATETLDGSTGIPAAGIAFTRLAMLILVARMCEAKLQGSQSETIDKITRRDLKSLAGGEITELNDPFLSGVDNSRSRRLLSLMAKIIPPWSPQQPDKHALAKQILFELAESLKLNLHSPAADGTYPDRADLAVHEQHWNNLCRFYAVPDLPPPSLTWGELHAAYTPAVQQVLSVLNKLVQASVGQRRVGLICLSGQGSLLREFHDPSVSLLWSLPPARFDLHPTRVKSGATAKAAKMAVAFGAMSIVDSEMEQKTWVWANRDLRHRLPYDIGVRRDNGDFVTLFQRGATLPKKITLTKPLRALTLYRRDYEDDATLLGRLRFDAPSAAEIVVTENREIITGTGVPVDRCQPVRDRNQVPMLNEMGREIPHW